MNQFLAIDDHSITEFLKACERASEDKLSELASGLLNRRLFKATDATGFNTGDVARFYTAVTAELKKAGADPEYTFVDDSPADTPYKPYDPDAEKPATQIYVEGPKGAPEEISKLSKPVQQLTEEYRLLRYYYPEAFRETVRAVAEATLKRGK